MIQTPRTAAELPTPRLEFAKPAPAMRAQSFDRLSAVANIVRLEQGLYALTIGETDSLRDEVSGLPVPMVQVSAPPDDDGRCIEIIGAGHREGWLGREGDTIVLRSPRAGGHVLVTAYGPPARLVAVPHLEVQRLDRLRTTNGAASESAYSTVEVEVRTEIVLHVERLGDRRFPGQGWVGNRGERLRIEAFSIRPVEMLAARDIEFMAVGPNRRQTPWVTDAKLCGTRGQGMPLTGFAIRLARQVREQFDVVYQGAFFESGVVGPHRNGELCSPPVGDDPLEAINVRVTRRIPERGRDSD